MAQKFTNCCHRPHTSNFFSGVAWSGSQFVVVGDFSTILTSPDGLTWTARNTNILQYPALPNLESVAWLGSQFVIVGDYGTILTSP